MADSNGEDACDIQDSWLLELFVRRVLYGARRKRRNTSRVPGGKRYGADILEGYSHPHGHRPSPRIVDSLKPTKGSN